MLKFINSSKDSSNNDLGTIWYKATIEDVQDALRDDGNLFVYYAISTEGFRCIDFSKHLFGSYVEDDTIYLCKTDGQYILFDGQFCDPEDAMEEYGPEKLHDYIQDATPDIIELYISPYEVEFDVDKGAIWLLNEDYSFKSIVDSYEDLPNMYY